jgi:6,7-dimethyl-8-ribityllumazine synthase
VAELVKAGAAYERIVVPGALEIPAAIRFAMSAEGRSRYDGFVALGCVIRGETFHYDVVCNNANHWLMEVATRRCVPVGNGILTVDTEAQAMERARGGRDGKGGDAVRACLRLVDIARQFQGQSV